MKNIWAFSIVLSVLLGALWFTHGQHLATLTEKPITTVAVDDFGDEVESVTWEKTLEIGLDVAAPGIAGFLLLGVGLSLLARQRKRIGPALAVLGGLGLVGALVSLVIAYSG